MTSSNPFTRRQLLGGLAALSAAGLLGAAGCSSSDSGGTPSAGSTAWSLPSTDPTATIKVLSILDLKTDNMQAVIDAFQKAHPTITVDFQTVPFDSLNSTLDARVANKGGDPDVYWADQPRISALAARGEAEDLTAAFSELPKTTSTRRRTTRASTRTSCGRCRSPTPPSCSTTTRPCSRRRACPSRPPSPDQRMTWEQLTTDAKKAKDAGAKYGFLFGQFDRYYQLEPLPVQLGGSVGASGDGNLTPDFTSDAWVKALYLVRQPVRGRRRAQAGSSPSRPTRRSSPGGPGTWSRVPGCCRSSRPPRWTGESRRSRCSTAASQPPRPGSWSLAMNPFSKQKDAAAVFLKWMAVDDGGGGYIKYLLRLRSSRPARRARRSTSPRTSSAPRQGKDAADDHRLRDVQHGGEPGLDDRLHRVRDDHEPDLRRHPQRRRPEDHDGQGVRRADDGVAEVQVVSTATADRTAERCRRRGPSAGGSCSGPRSSWRRP